MTESKIPEQLENLPKSEGEMVVSVPILSDEDRLSLSLPEGTWWLHARVKRKCRLIYASHRHAAWTTKTSDPNSERVNVDKIVLYSRIGGDNDTKECPSTNGCDRLEEEYNVGCRRSCVSAAAYKNGGWARTDWACV